MGGDWEQEPKLNPASYACVIPLSIPLRVIHSRNSDQTGIIDSKDCSNWAAAQVTWQRAVPSGKTRTRRARCAAPVSVSWEQVTALGLYR